MASKGQKFNKYSKKIKELIINELSKGKTYTELSREYNVNAKTISTWQQKLRHPEKYPGLDKKHGRPREKDLTKEDYKERYEILKKYQAFLKAQRERK
ncbi:MAG: helix-turn-helix domain-containing protein [Bacilli bacterium]|nr:helix-turn-helix domain-containing protein [Bacilli bacterium]